MMLCNKSLQLLLRRGRRWLILTVQKATERLGERMESRMLLVRQIPTLQDKCTIRYVRFDR
jgi:hypothetical protein